MKRAKNYASVLLTSVIIVIGFVYTARGLTDIYDKETNLKTIIADAGFSTLVSFLIGVLLTELSITNTLLHEDILNSKKAKGEILVEISPYLGKGHIFCQKRNEEERKLRKEIIIRKYFIDLESYQEYLKNGGIKNKEISFWSKLSLWRMERKIKRVNYDTYKFEEILNGTTQPELAKKKRVTIKGFRTKKYGKKILSSVITGIVFGYFGLKLAKEPDWGMVIYLAIQFTTFITNGIIQYFITRSYILNEYRDQIKEDTNFLYEFKGSITLHPEWYVVKEVVKKEEKPIIEVKKDKTPTESVEEEKTNFNLVKEEGEPLNELSRQN